MAVAAFDVLGDPVRRRILELLAGDELSSGAICEVIRGEFGISQPAVSAQLRVLRESGLATVRSRGNAAARTRSRPSHCARSTTGWTASVAYLDAAPGRAGHRGGAWAPGARHDTGHREETAMMDVEH